MLGLNMCITIQTLWKQGKNKSEISRLTNHDWKTVHNVIKALEQGKSKPDKKPRKSLLLDDQVFYSVNAKLKCRKVAQN